MWAARKTSPLGVAAPGVPFPLSCRHHDGRLRRARPVLFACLYSTSTYRFFGSFVQSLGNCSGGIGLFVATCCWFVATFGYGFCISVIGLLLLQFSPYDVTGTSFPRDLLLALLEVFKGPWLPLGVEGRWPWRWWPGCMFQQYIRCCPFLPVVGCLLTLKVLSDSQEGRTTLAVAEGRSDFKRKSCAGTHWLNVGAGAV